MKDNGFKCSMCGSVYEKGLSEEVAQKEYETLFTEKEREKDMSLVCDDCWNKHFSHIKKRN